MVRQCHRCDVRVCQTSLNECLVRKSIQLCTRAEVKHLRLSRRECLGLDISQLRTSLKRNIADVGVANESSSLNGCELLRNHDTLCVNDVVEGSTSSIGCSTSSCSTIRLQGSGSNLDYIELIVILEEVGFNMSDQIEFTFCINRVLSRTNSLNRDSTCGKCSGVIRSNHLVDEVARNNVVAYSV